MTEEMVKALIAMGWERAKGELFAILSVYWNNDDNGAEFLQLKHAIETFMKEIEGNSLLR